MIALDLFAGVGWGVACQRLGIDEYGVELMPEARATREAAGMNNVYDDVWMGLEDSSYIIEGYGLLIASPPCQTFSMAGNGKGRAALSEVLEAIEERAYLDPAKLRAFGEKHDPRTALVLTPLAYIARDLPTYVVLEQVPSVLPVWNAYGMVMRLMGYSVVTELLHAEQFGVPQARTRAILIGRRDGKTAVMPTPTHSRYYARDKARLDQGVLPYVTMASALGWGLTDSPYPTVTGGETETGGAEPIAKLVRYTMRPDWVHRRPATTVVANDIISGPGRSEFVKGGVSRQNRPGSLRVTPSEAGILQSFPANFPWQGTKGKKHLQSGNAVPPLLAEAILKTLL